MTSINTLIYGQPAYQGITNRTIIDEQGTNSIQVFHERILRTVRIARSLQDLEAVSSLDDAAFVGHRGSSLQELIHIYDVGKVLMLENESGELIGESQLLLSPIPELPELAEDEAYCYGMGLKPGEEGKGYAQVLYKAQEVIAREANKSRVTLTVRVENARSIRASLRMGFRIVGYDKERFGPFKEGGARLIMSKSFTDEPFPFDPALQAERVRANIVTVLNGSNYKAVLATEPIEVGIPVTAGHAIDQVAHSLVEYGLTAGYTGTGLLRPDECGWSESSKSMFIFQKREARQLIKCIGVSPTVGTEYAKLREVIVSYSPFAASITQDTAINSVARRNIGRLDPIAFHDEHGAFNDVLQTEGVRLVRSSLLGSRSSGMSAVFTRDPALVIDDTIVICALGRAERQNEEAEMRRLSQGLRTVHLSGADSGHVIVEGGDVVILDHELVAVGLGERTNEEGLKKLTTFFPARKFIGVRHIDLHLDVLFTVVGEKIALADTTRLPHDFIQFLLDNGYTLITADPHEQVTLGCNVLAVDNRKVIAAAENRITNQRLRDNGVQVIEVSMPNIIKKGGGPRCLVCPVRRGYA